MKPIFHQKGLSLIELLIAMVLGLVLLVGVSALYSSSARSYNDNLKVTQLNQELRAALTMMSNDIRRAGFAGIPLVNPLPNQWANQWAIQNPFQAINVNGDANCILFSYDHGNGSASNVAPNGTLDSVLNNALSPGQTFAVDESFGYRLSNGALQSRVNGADCDANGWQSLTDSSITITNLQFTLNQQPVNGPDADNDGTADYVLTVRDVRILLTGRLTNDATVTRTLDTTVRVRNDLFTPGT